MIEMYGIYSQKPFKYLQLLLVIVCISLVITGCIDFGKDMETTSPTDQQVSKCKEIMCLNQDLNLEPLGLKSYGSGIDDAILFKFKTSAKSMEDIFDTDSVDTSSFSEDYSFREEKGLEWWDVTDKKFTGGQVSLPNAKYMNVGLQEEDEGFIVYIYWFET